MLFEPTVYGRDALSVKPHLRIVRDAVVSQLCRVASRNRRAVEGHPLILAHLLEIERAARLDLRRDIIPDVCVERGHYRVKGHRGDFVRNRRRLDAERVEYDFPVFEICLCRTTLLIDGSTVVVAREVRLVAAFASVVRPGGEAKGRSSVRDKEAERTATLHEPLHGTCDVARLPRAFVPVAKPAGISFGGENRNAGVVLCGEAPVFLVHSGVEADGDFGIGIDQVFEKSIACPVRHVERTEPALLPEVLYPPQVFDVLERPAAVFVLDLRQHYRPAVLCEERLGYVGDGGKILLRLGEIARVHRPHGDIVLQKTRRDSPKVPLAADVGPWTEQHPHPHLFADREECGDVAAAGLEVKRSVGLLKIVPHEVGRYCIESHCLAHSHPVTPVFARDALRLNFPCAYLDAFPVDKKLTAVLASK